MKGKIPMMVARWFGGYAADTTVQKTSSSESSERRIEEALSRQQEAVIQLERELELFRLALPPADQQAGHL